MGRENRAIAYLDAEDTSQAAFAAFRANVATTQGRLEALKGTLASVAGAVGMGAYIHSLDTAIDRADEFSKMSQRAGGISVEWLSTTAHAADLSGVSMENLEGVLKKLNVKLDEAKGGSSLAGQQLERLGVNVKGVRDGTVDAATAFDQIAERVRGAGDGFEKTGALVDVMGKNASTVIPLMNSDLGELREEARKLGLQISTQTAQQAEQFNDQLRTLEGAAQGARNALVSDMLPGLTRITRAMKEAAVEGGFLRGILAGIQTALTGDDRMKSDQELTDLVDRKFRLENKLAESYDQTKAFHGDTPSKIKQELDAVEAQIKTVMALRSQLDIKDEAEAKAEAARRAAMAKIGAKPGQSAATGAAGVDPFDTLKRQLQEEATRVGDVTVAERVLHLLQTERYKDLTAAQRGELINIAAGIDLIKDREQFDKDIAKDREERQKKEDDAQKAQIDRLGQLRTKYTDLADATAPLYRELAELSDLQKSAFAIDPEQADVAYFKLQQKINDILDGVKEKGKDTTSALIDAFNGFGRQASRALATMAVEGKFSFDSLANVAKNFATDVLDKLIYKRFMDPAVNAASGFLDKMLPQEWKFADGGIMTSEGPLPLRRYASGGVANSPQVSIWGEGDMPEANVPLPDGRTIPVSLRGGGMGGSQPQPVNLRVEVVNKSSAPVQATQSAPRFDAGEMVVGIVLQDLSVNGPVSQALSSRFQPGH